MSNAKIEEKPKFVLARNKGFPFIFIVRSTRPKRSAKHGFEVGIAHIFRQGEAKHATSNGGDV